MKYLSWQWFLLSYDRISRTPAFGSPGAFPNSPLGSPASPLHVVSPRLPPSPLYTRPGIASHATATIPYSQPPLPTTIPPAPSSCHSLNDEVCTEFICLILCIISIYTRCSLHKLRETWVMSSRWGALCSDLLLLLTWNHKHSLSVHGLVIMPTAHSNCAVRATRRATYVHRYTHANARSALELHPFLQLFTQLYNESWLWTMYCWRPVWEI